MSEGSVILFTGSQTWTDLYGLRLALNDIRYEFVDVNGNPPILRLGGAIGADTAAEDIWRGWGLQVEIFRPNWYAPCVPRCKHRPRRSVGRCPAAGIYRNELMVLTDPEPVYGLACIVGAELKDGELIGGTPGSVYTYNFAVSQGIDMRLETQAA